MDRLRVHLSDLATSIVTLKRVLRSSAHVDDVCLGSGDDCAPSFHDDVDDCAARLKAQSHHARADDVRRERVDDRAQSLHAHARVHVAQSGATKRRLPLKRQRSQIDKLESRA